MNNNIIVQFIESFQEFQWNNPQEIKKLRRELISHKKFLEDQEENSPLGQVNFLENQIQKEIVKAIVKRLNNHLKRLNE